MQSERSAKQVTARLLTSLLGVAVCTAVAALPALAQTQTGPGASVPQPPAEKPAAAREGTSGMKVYIDPQTGRILRDPPAGTAPLQLSPQEQNALSTSHQGLVEVPSSQPGGGFKLDLQGRFQSPLVGTVDANGKVKVQHLGDQHETHGSGDKK